jgi:hypothetical protein
VKSAAARGAFRKPTELRFNLQSIIPAVLPTQRTNSFWLAARALRPLICTGQTLLLSDKLAKGVVDPCG